MPGPTRSTPERTEAEESTETPGPRRYFNLARRRRVQIVGAMPAPLTIYTLAQCSTCRDATKWLRAHGLEFVEKPIRETPPSGKELRAMLSFQNGELRRLVNSSGLEYRALGMKDKFPQLSTDAALALLAGNGSLVKRPFVLGPKVGLVGFDPEKWAAALA